MKNVNMNEFRKLSAEEKEEFINDYYWTQVEPVESIYYLGIPDEEDVEKYEKATKVYETLRRIVESEASEDDEVFGVDLYSDERYYKAM